MKKGTMVNERRRAYEQPLATVVEIETRNCLLAGSGTLQDYEPEPDPFNP